LIEEGKVDVECKEYGRPAILNAAWKGNNRFIEFLLFAGADINGKIKNTYHNALHFAAFKGKIETVKLLVSLGCDFKAKTADGKTPLQEAENAMETNVLHFLKQVERKYVSYVISLVLSFFFLLCSFL
jgi:ankyrin repeat protein